MMEVQDQVSHRRERRSLCYTFQPGGRARQSNESLRCKHAPIMNHLLQIAFGELLTSLPPQIEMAECQ